MTPESESSTPYFWTIGRRNDVDDAGLTQAMVGMVYTAFDQDKDLVEAQFRNLPNGDIRGLRLAACKEGQAPMRARAVIERLAQTA